MSEIVISAACLGHYTASKESPPIDLYLNAVQKFLDELTLGASKPKLH